MAHALDYNTQVVPLELFADNPLRLAPEDHPNGYWSETHGNYNQWWAHYKGYTLNKKANGLDVYPVKLNIVRPAVINHAALLLGQLRIGLSALASLTPMEWMRRWVRTLPATSI